ncbi:hypothetical protein [Actinoplanes siamensis]|uniref:Uncharacterized protein n=1 Tax=Actinoplanes siamensis TaxID=1223317 RepID=A0A919NE86_9ACTN|nr:hypothetical protein [Actinoplanes siamensis]GIF09288.1 hypothetical protein Asi03nite_68260 [Actinoplanes siamensis]
MTAQVLFLGVTLTTPSTVTPATAPAVPAAPQRLAARLWALSEIRWATLSTLLFAAGGIAQLAGAPASV